MRRFTRLANGVSKKPDNLKAAATVLMAPKGDRPCQRPPVVAHHGRERQELILGTWVEAEGFLASRRASTSLPRVKIVLTMRKLAERLSQPMRKAVRMVDQE